MELKNYSGRKFGRLTAIKFSHKIKYTGYWTFHCLCGRSKEISISSVISGATRSCGCLHMERCKSGLNRTIHGDARHGRIKRVFNIWRGILNRCKTDRIPAYNYYKKRGIKVCFEWGKSYLAFRKWAYSNGYKDNLSIDRINNNGNYDPMNCRWVTSKEQARNRKTSKFLIFKKQKKTCAEWSDITGLSQGLICARIKILRWSIEKTLSTPAKEFNYS